jgi:hypothetical protein
MQIYGSGIVISDENRNKDSSEIAFSLPLAIVKSNSDIEPLLFQISTKINFLYIFQAAWLDYVSVIIYN